MTTETKLFRGTHELGHQSQVLSGCVRYGTPKRPIVPRDVCAENLDELAGYADRDRGTLRVTYLSPKAGREYRSRVPGVCCNYRIFVRQYGAIAFTAFATKRAFREWLEAYGLTVENWRNQRAGCWSGTIDPAKAGERKPVTVVTSGWAL